MTRYLTGLNAAGCLYLIPLNLVKLKKYLMKLNEWKRVVLLTPLDRTC